MLDAGIQRIYGVVGDALNLLVEPSGKVAGLAFRSAPGRT